MLSGGSLKLVDLFTNLGKGISSTQNDINSQRRGQLSIRYQLYGSQTFRIKYNAIFSMQLSCPYYYMDAPMDSD